MKKLVKTILGDKTLLIVLTVGLLIRIVLNDTVNSKDAESFIFWGNYLREHSIASMFESLPGGYTPLPPLYYYATRILSNLADLLSISDNLWITHLLFKLPSIFVESAVTVLIYSFVAQTLSNKHARVTSAFYFLNPAVIYNTAIWGQIDSFVSGFAFISAVLITKKRFFTALVIYLIAILSKLQALAILPLIVLQTILNLKNRKTFFYLLILTMLAYIPFLPVVSQKGILWTIAYFKELPNWYPYTSIYTYNLWAPTGFIIPDSEKFLTTISYRYLAQLFYWIFAVLIVWPIINPKKRNPRAILFAAFLLFFDFAYFSTRIHSRYLIYTMPFASLFVTRLPREVISLNLLIIANLMLPMDFRVVGPIVTFLNMDLTIILFSTFGFILFLKLYYEYKILINEL